jgi:hypothetical protein
VKFGDTDFIIGYNPGCARLLGLPRKRRPNRPKAGKR